MPRTVRWSEPTTSLIPPDDPDRQTAEPTLSDVSGAAATGVGASGRGLRWRPVLPSNALVAGAPAGRRAAAVVALGFVAMLASSAGQSFWLALFVDDMIVGTGLSRTGFSVVYAVATIASAVMVVVIGTLFERRGPTRTCPATAVA